MQVLSGGVYGDMLTSGELWSSEDALSTFQSLNAILMAVKLKLTTFSILKFSETGPGEGRAVVRTWGPIACYCPRQIKVALGCRCLNKKGENTLNAAVINQA